MIARAARSRIASVKKQVFSIKLLEQQKVVQVAKLKSFLVRCAIVAAAIVVICMGHVYGSIAILIIATLIYRAVTSQKKREEVISRNVFFANIEWYVYVITFYSLLPRIFLRRDLFQNGGINETHPQTLNQSVPLFHGGTAGSSSNTQGKEDMVDVLVSEATRYLKLFIFDYHQTIRSTLMIAGSMIFMVSLKLGFIKYQLRRLAWSVIVIVFVFCFTTS
jgi:hypothetical protein